MADLDIVPHDAHIRLADKVFRDAGFTLAAMQFKRPPEALSALRAFNRVPDTFTHPFPWGYFPNEWMRDNWRSLYHPKHKGTA